MIKKHPSYNKQTKNRNCIIKLQVNRLIKSQINKVTHHKNTKSQFINNHKSSLQKYENNKSLEKQTQSKPQKKVIKTFQQMYFQKIKKIKLQQSNLLAYQQNNKFIESQKLRPNSCKNLVSIKIKNKSSNILTSKSVKNKQYETNKQNISTQKENDNINVKQINKFFKKKELSMASNSSNLLKISKSNINQIQRNNNQSFQKLPQSQQIKIEQIKVKKVLKLKKTISTNKDQIITNQKEKGTSFQSFKNIQIPQNNQFQQKIEKLSLTQGKSSFFQLDSNINPSLELKSFKLSTPQSSAQKNQSVSQIQNRYNQISQTKINHLNHSHIWNGSQCFFQFNQFQLILQQLGFKDNFHCKQINLYVNKLWEHLGGDLYGGVVRKNMRDFLIIVLEQDKNINSEIAQILTSKGQIILKNNFIDKSSLKLNNLCQKTKDQIRKFYFPFRIAKLASQIHNFNFNSQEKSQISNNLAISTGKNQKFHRVSGEKSIKQSDKKQDSTQLHLQNNAYLDSISIKNRYENISPLLPKNHIYESNELNFVTDFSPKMSSQQYQPFKSTILHKDQYQNQKIQTQQSDPQQNKVQINRKPLLSVDVNLGEGILQKLMVYEGQNPYDVSLQLKQRYNIEEELRQKFQKMLRNHLNSLLFKIQQVSEQLFEDSLELKDGQNQKDFILMQRE